VTLENEKPAVSQAIPSNCKQVLLNLAHGMRWSMAKTPMGLSAPPVYSDSTGGNNRKR